MTDKTFTEYGELSLIERANLLAQGIRMARDESKLAPSEQLKQLIVNNVYSRVDRLLADGEITSEQARAILSGADVG